MSIWAFSRHSMTKPARYIAPFARSFFFVSRSATASPKRLSATVRKAFALTPTRPMAAASTC